MSFVFVPAHHWTTWEAWSSCSASCGEGMRNRTRTCDTSTLGISLCAQAGEGATSSESCFEGQCRDGDYSGWGDWSYCSATCYTNATKTRSKVCLEKLTQDDDTVQICDPVGGEVTETGRCTDKPEDCPGNRYLQLDIQYAGVKLAGGFMAFFGRLVSSVFLGQVTS